ncbi:MAG: aminoglycoside phosphotransferase, partial [Actinomycetales bacterium]|nr:aminoglycoside phosphotransferase [Actinomycetales bacterium]
MLPPAEVYDLFAVPADPVRVAGGRGHSVLAGDLVLSPGRGDPTAGWLSPLLARLAADLDHEHPRALRLAMPIPTRDLRWVVQGWGATRFEPGTRPCRDLDVLVATG